MCSDILLQFFEAFADAQLAELVRFTPFFMLLFFHSKYFNQSAFLEPQKATKSFIMKKIVVFLLLISFSIQAQRHYELLRKEKLKALIKKGDGNSYDDFLALGFHYYQIFKLSKIVAAKNEGLVRSKDYLKKAIDLHKGNRDNNHLKALYYYGILNLELKNTSFGYQYISEAAQGEFLPAIYRMAHFFEKGIGFKKDIDKAMLLYKKIASVPDNEFKAEIFDRIGRIYHHEFNDNERAIVWLAKALDLGFSESTYLFLKIREDYNMDYVIKTKYIPCFNNQSDTRSFLILDEKKSSQNVTEYLQSKITNDTHFKKRAKELNESYVERNQENVKAVIRILFDNKGLHSDTSILYKQGKDFATINLKKLFKTDVQYKEKDEFKYSVNNVIKKGRIYIKPPIKKCKYEESYIEFDYLLSEK